MPVIAEVTLVESFTDLFTVVLERMGVLCGNGRLSPVKRFEGPFAGGFAVHSILLLEAGRRQVRVHCFAEF